MTKAKKKKKQKERINLLYCICWVVKSLCLDKKPTANAKSAKRKETTAGKKET